MKHASTKLGWDFIWITAKPFLQLTHRGEEAEEQASADHSVAAAAQRRHEKKRQDAAVPDRYSQCTAVCPLPKRKFREQPLAEANVEEALLQVIATGLLDKSSVAQKSMYAITVLLRERYAQKVNAAGRPLTESLKPFVKATYEAVSIKQCSHARSSHSNFHTSI